MKENFVLFENGKEIYRSNNFKDCLHQLYNNYRDKGKGYYSIYSEIENMFMLLYSVKIKE